MTALTSTDLPPRRPNGLLAAFLVALALHALVLVGIMYARLAPPAPPGEQQVTIDLAPVMAEAETVAPAETQASEAAPPETKPVEEPVEEATQPPPPPDTAAVKPEESQAVTAVEEKPVAATEAKPVEPDGQVITSTAPEAETVVPPPPEQVAKTQEPEEPKPDLAQLKAEKEARLKKIRDEKRKEEARRERLEQIREAKEAKAKAEREARTKAALARQGETRESAAASRRSSEGRAAAGNDPSAMRQWTGAISAAIHGRMNPGAAAGTSGGTAVVRFTVLRSGSVTSAGLARSSGVGQIDSAALSAVRGSLPAAPAGVTQPSLSVTIPLNYRVR
jgi:periplasmic protein TonB